MDEEILSDYLPLFIAIIAAIVVFGTYFLFRWIFAVEKRLKLQEEQLQVLKNIEKALAKEKDLV